MHVNDLFLPVKKAVTICDNYQRIIYTNEAITSFNGSCLMKEVKLK